MKHNYDSVDMLKETCSTNSLQKEETSYSVKKQTWLSFLSAFLMLFSFVFVQGQTTLISPTGDGGFENGATFAANGWQVINPATDTWQVGNVPVSSNGARCAYISANGGAAWTYSQFSVFNHMYKDITIPAGENKVTLSFKWKVGGEGTTTSDWDNLKVFLSPTSFTPTATAAVSGARQLIGPGATSGMYKLSSTSWNAETIVFSAAPGTYRLIFQWKSDGLDIANPPAALDEISLTSQAPGNFISVANGNWTNPATWDANAVPTGADNAIVAAHTVTIDAASLSINNLTVQGSLEFGATPTTFNVNGNLTVEVGGEFLVLNGTTGKAIVVSGNIVNNGNIDLSIGATTAGSLTLNGSAVQSITGSGAFTNNLIRNLIFTNTATATPNVIWGFNNIKIANNLDITGARINLNANKIYFGNNAAGGTFTAPVGTGFINGSFSRWWTTGTTGTAITAGTDPIGTASRYPFITSNGSSRALYITRSSSTTTGNTAGYLTAVYNDVAGFTTGLSIADGAYTITDRSNGNWQVSAESGYVYTSGTHTLVGFYSGGILVTSNTAARLMNPNAVVGTFQNGSTTPVAQRTGITSAQLIAEPFHIGVNAADVPFVSASSGDWNVGTTWNKGTVPTCTDVVTIANGHIVTSSSSGNFAKNITIATGGTLVVSGGDLTVGCTLNNNTLTNNGTLTVSGGLLAVNGNISNTAGSTFNHTGGNIDIDGNNGGSATGSVASGTPLLLFLSNNINLAGGTITIIDPHTATTNTNAVAVKFDTSSATANSRNTSPSHILQFGDGVSTDAGGNTSGFFIDSWTTTGYLVIGKLVVNGATGTNRFVSSRYNLSVRGDIDVEANSTLNLATPLVLGGNLLVKLTGNYTNTSGTALNYVIDNTGSNLTFSPVTLPQTITNNGVMANAVASPTANLFSLEVNNTNAVGVTLNSPISISGTLTMTSGIINTTNTNLLTLGTATAAGTLAGTPSATNMVRGPFARTIANANANTNYILFPVGKTTYAPVWAAPATTAVSVMKAETFDANTGTQSAAITNMTTNRRWELPLVSGSITNINVRLGDAGIVATSIPVQAPSATGEYTNSFGSVATAVAGATTQSNTAITSANYTGFLSYADSNACSGTPSPGNTLASTNSICLGTAVNLSLQNVTSGTGVTYQWKSSTDGITYTAISGATNATLSVTPSESTYYVCDVTCATGPATGTSTAVQITFTNSVTATTPGTRCGTGTVDLSATPSAGASIKWYAAETGGTVLGTGNSFTTPSIAATTTYYAGSESTSPGTAQLGTGTTTSGGSLSAFNNYWTSAKYHMIYTASELAAIGLSAGDISSIAYKVTSLGDVATNANYTVKIGTTSLATFANTTFTAPTFTTCYGPSTYTHTSSGWQTINFSTPYTWDGISNIIIEVSHDGANGSSSANTEYTATTGNTVLYSYNGSNFNNTLSANRFNVLFAGQLACHSARVPVVGTVTTPPALTLSASTATICESNSTAVTLTSTAGDYDTYTWSPSTGIVPGGDENTGWTFNPSVSTNYTLTASQTGGSLCTTTATFAVTVNPRPSAMTIAPSPAPVCVDAIQALSVSGGTIGSSGSSQIGTATTFSTSSSLPTAFCNRYDHYWVQMVYTAAELTAAGVQAGNITALRFKTGAQGSANNVTDFKVRLGNTSNSTLTGFTTSGLTQVFSAATYATVVGFNTITFDTPYVWDGTSNIIVDMRQTGVDLSSNTTTEYTATAGNTAVSATTSTPNAGGSDGFAASAPTATPSVNRLNTTFVWDSSVPTTITWLPIDNLYTDATATTAYVENANASTVYFKSSTTAAAVTYTATSTTSFLCTRTATTDVTVNSNNTVTAASSSPTVCINTAITDITHTTTGATGFATTTTNYGLPAGVTAVLASNTITISGTPTASGTFNYDIPLTGGCGTVSATGTITVTANNTASIASSTPTVCINTAITDITHATIGATNIGTPTGLPAGVTANWSADTITISGTPSASGTFNYDIPLTGGCGTVSATGTITVTAINTASAASSSPTVCINTAITDISHTTTGATGFATTTTNYGLPAGVTAVLASNTITISGTPTASGTFNYDIPLTGGCGTVSATGTITVTANNTASTASSTPTVCINTAIIDITHATIGATNIGAPTGLPAGVTANWSADTITISGAPSASGTFNYDIPLTGGCGTVSATGTIIVTANNTASAASSTPTVCINTAITDITHDTIGATNIGTPTGLPAGVTATWASNTITISGTPSAAGTFNYSIPLTGGCGTVSATGTITVTAANTAGAASSSPSVCINTAITDITHTTTGATGIGTATGLPAGVTATWASNTITISGTPSVAGTFNYSIPLTGGCGTVSATGTITVTAANTAGAASSSPSVCINTAITDITHTTTGATGIGTATGLPAGVTATWASNTITISGTPSVAGTFNYSIPLTGGCGTVSATGTITVNALPNATITRTGDTLTATESGATYQWYTCSAGPVYTIISGATSQSYVVTAIGSYAVEVTKNGCTTMSTCFDVTTLSNNSFNLTQLTYYPNPVISNFTVTYTRAITSIQVFDINGRLVKNMKTNNNEVNVDMSDVAASVYIVKVFADDTMGEFKVVKTE